MAGRMSNRDRIDQLRREAEATAKEKAAAKAEKAARPPAPRKKASGSGTRSAATPSRGRVRMVWKVCDSSGKEVSQFPYAQEEEARAEALQQTTATGRTHFVAKAEVPFA
jgi:hypothetical protein